MKRCARGEIVGEIVEIKLNHCNADDAPDECEQLFAFRRP